MARLLKYDQAKLTILRAISEGDLHQGERLPSEREMMRRYGVSQISFRRALAELEGYGLVERKLRRGTFLARELEDFEAKEMVLLLVLRSDEHDDDPARVNSYAFENALRKHGLGTLVMTAARPEQRVAKMVQRSAAVVLTGAITEEWTLFLKALSVPNAVVLGNFPFEHGFPAVTLDYFEAARLLTKEFVHQGCRRIGFINTWSKYFPAQEFDRGYRAALEEENLPFFPELELCPRPYQETIQKEIAGFLDMHAGLDAIFCERYAFFPLLRVGWERGKSCAKLGAVGLGRENLVAMDGMGGLTVSVFPSMATALAELTFEHLTMPGDIKKDKLLHPEVIELKGE